MLWISYPLSKKEFCLKLAVPKKLGKILENYLQENSLGAQILLKKALSLVFPKDFAKLAYPLHYTETYTARKMKFFIKDFFSKRNCGSGHIY